MSIEISRNNGARQDDCIVACESIPDFLRLRVLATGEIASVTEDYFL